MDTKNLATFIQTAELKSFTKAAQKLGYTQSTVSFQIRQLETELGVPLFDRINRTVSLTPAGTRLLRNAGELMALLRGITEDSAEQEVLSGKVRLAMADSLCRVLMASVVPVLREKYPKITLEIYSAGTEEMFRLLNHNEVDLVCTMDSHIYDASYIIDREQPLGVHFVCAPEMLPADGPITMERLQRLPLMLTEKHMSYRSLLDELLASRSQELSPVLECGNVSLLRELAEGGIGITFLPDFITAPAVEAGKLARLETPDVEVGVWLQLLHHRDKWISDTMQAVIDQIGLALEELR